MAINRLPHRRSLGVRKNQFNPHRLLAWTDQAQRTGQTLYIGLVTGIVQAIQRLGPSDTLSRRTMEAYFVREWKLDDTNDSPKLADLRRQLERVWTELLDLREQRNRHS